jgi:hypothetical protein
MTGPYAIQDGPDFYQFKGDGPDEEPFEVVNSPFEFSDGDLAEAEKARTWYSAQHPDIPIDPNAF